MLYAILQGCTKYPMLKEPKEMKNTHTLSPAYNEQCDAKESARCSQVLVVTELVVAGILLAVQCCYLGAILSHLMSTNH